MLGVLYARKACMANLHKIVTNSIQMSKRWIPTRTWCRHTDSIVSGLPKTMVAIIVWIGIGTWSISSLDADITCEWTGSPFRPHTPISINCQNKTCIQRPKTLASTAIIYMYVFKDIERFKAWMGTIHVDDKLPQHSRLSPMSSCKVKERLNTTNTIINMVIPNRVMCILNVVL